MIGGSTSDTRGNEMAGRKADVLAGMNPHMPLAYHFQGDGPYRTGVCGLVGMIGTLSNASFVEWLMGFPIDHTVCEPSAMPSSRKSRKSSAVQSVTTNSTGERRE